MKAKILRGKNKGMEVEISQWCNDWFTLKTGDPAIDCKPVSPTSLAFTHDGIVTIQNNKINGILFKKFCTTSITKNLDEIFPYVFTFKRRKYWL